MWAVCFHLFSPHLSSLTPFPLPSLSSVPEEKAIVQVSVVGGSSQCYTIFPTVSALAVKPQQPGYRASYSPRAPALNMSKPTQHMEVKK